VSERCAEDAHETDGGKQAAVVLLSYRGVPVLPTDDWMTEVWSLLEVLTGRQFGRSQWGIKMEPRLVRLSTAPCRGPSVL
jgi:hypothetical protein